MGTVIVLLKNSKKKVAEGRLFAFNYPKFRSRFSEGYLTWEPTEEGRRTQRLKLCHHKDEKIRPTEK